MVNECGWNAPSGQIIPEEVMSLLGTHVIGRIPSFLYRWLALLDQTIGEVFFSDPARMHIDLMGPAAVAYLKSKFE